MSEKLSDVAAKAVSPVNLGSLGITQAQFDAMPQAAKAALAKSAALLRDAEAAAQAAAARAERAPSVKLSDKGYFVVLGLPQNPTLTFSPKGLAVILNGFAETLTATLAEHGESQQVKLNEYLGSDARKARLADIKAERAAQAAK
jgi:hypothetical protein